MTAIKDEIVVKLVISDYLACEVRWGGDSEIEDIASNWLIERKNIHRKDSLKKNI